MSLKFYGPHGVAKETLASGAPIPEGDFFELDREALEDPHNIRLIKERKILPGSKAAQKAADDAVAAEPVTVPSEGGDSADNNEGGEGGEA